DPDDGVEVCVVIRFSGKYLNAEGSFFQLPRVSVQGPLDYVPQQIWIALAVLEERVRKDAFQLRLDRRMLQLIFVHSGHHRMYGACLLDLPARRKERGQPTGDCITWITVMIRQLQAPRTAPADPLKLQKRRT